MKCDLGSVDNPSDPPCSRCRRESKQCYFASERRKKRKTGEQHDSEEEEEGLFEIRNGTRKRVRSRGLSEVRNDAEDIARPRTPGGSIALSRPLQRPTTAKPVQFKEEDEKISEHTAALLQHRELHSGHDALNMLHAAATTIQEQSRAAMGGDGAILSPPLESSATLGRSNGFYNTDAMSMFSRQNTLDARPSIAEMQYTAPSLTPERKSAIAAWSRFRFVRSGWFTANEGIEYITYFYAQLAPLTPVALPNFRPLDTHKKLLEEETMLAVTMLLIASRHMKLSGPGSNSRPYAIHDKLWSYLSGMIDRVIWGQEQFGGGLCGAGAQASCDVNPLSRKGMRTLGTVESLVLLTEWHPRAMHFPPAQDDNELMHPEPGSSTPDSGDNNGAAKTTLGGLGGQPMDAWLEPCWRSDRMCWMLLGLAMTLAFEIGIFDSSEWQRHAKNAFNQPLSPDEFNTYNRRRSNVRDLLLVYVTQTSGRIGVASMLPASYNDPRESDLLNRKIGPMDTIQDATLHFWLRMASLVKDGNTKVFPNKEATRNLIRTRLYRQILAELEPELERWRKDFDACKQIPKVMRSILLIEWEYARAYVNALSLQAIAERCARDDVHPMDPPLEMARSVTKTGDLLMTPSQLSKHFSGERQFTMKVAESARNLLKIVVEDLYPNDSLKHAPVRTYFRIISVCVLMFKSFCLGAPESDVMGSLALLDQTVDALRTCIVDDVHVASRFAELLETLINGMKPRLVRMAADGRGGRLMRSQRESPMTLQGDTVQGNTAMNATDPQYAAQLMPPTMNNTPHWSPQLNGMSSSNGNGISHSLLGISDDTYDVTANNNAWSVMPPPGFNNNSPNNNSNNTMGSGVNGYDSYINDTMGMTGDQDWLTLPLDPLLNFSGVDVTHTQFGPDVGGHDMLELLLGGGGGFPSGNGSSL